MPSLLVDGINLAEVVIGSLVLLIVAIIVRTIYALCLSPYHKIPGPLLCKISRYWLVYWDFTLQRNEKVYEWHQQYGPVVLVAPGELSFATPSATREIYGATGRYPKSDYFSRFATYGERPTFTVKDYEEHRQKRKLTFALFQPTVMYGAAYVNPIRARAKAFLEKINKDIKDNSSVDFFASFTLYVFDNMSRFAYGPRHACHSIDNECGERSMLLGLRECEIWNNRLFDFPTLYWLFQQLISCVTNNKNFLTAEHKLTDWNTEKLTVSRNDPSISSDDSLLRYLNDVKTKDGTALTPNYIASEMLDNLNGAQTTTTAALTYVMWNIARNPAWQDRVREELRQLPLQEDELPSWADVNASPVLDACIKESYRINPISSGRAERVTPREKVFEHIFVPSGVSECLPFVTPDFSPLL